MTKSFMQLTLFILLFCFVSYSTAGEIEKIELSNLDGNWVGSGEF